MGVLYLFSGSGLVSRLATGAGLIDSPAGFPAMVNDPWAIGIIIQYVWKEIPFIGVIVLAILLSVGEDYESVARSLGANRWQAFRNVTLPLIMPGVVSASVIVFAFTFGAFEIPWLLGSTFPKALPVLAYESYTDVDLAARPQAMAMAMVIAVMSSLMILAYMNVSSPVRAELGRWRTPGSNRPAPGRRLLHRKPRSAGSAGGSPVGG